MLETSYDMDIAISFLNNDLGLAQELRELLGSDLDVFLYTEKQVELAGTDGLESFREVFRHRSRLVVILYREGWGHTPWTRVEQEAITDRFLKEGAEFLFVVMLDDSQPPPWLPDKLIRFNLKDFGVEQAVGAIKARALEQGSAIHRPSPATLAEQTQEAVEFQKRRSQLLRTEEGVRAAATEAIRVIKLIEEGTEELQEAARKLGIEHGVDRYAIVVRTGDVALEVAYHNHIVNVLDKARLLIREIAGSVLLPGQHGHYIRDPKELKVTEFFPDVSRAYGWCWRNLEGQVFTSEKIAELSTDKFLALVECHATGELPPRS